MALRIAFISGVFCCLLAVGISAQEAAVAAVPPAAAVEDPEATIRQQRQDAIRYGTDEEIMTVITAIKTDADRQYDAEMLLVFAASANEKLLTLLLGYFYDVDEAGAEEKALLLVEDRDEYRQETVEAAMRYLGLRKAKTVLPVCLDIIEGEEERFLGAAIRALGFVGGADEAERLIKYYPGAEDNENVQQEIISSLGRIGNAVAVDFLFGIVENAEAKPVRKMAALDALGKIASERSREAILEAVRDADPNVRTQAVAGLVLYRDAEAEAAVLNAFRDSFYKVRIGAAKVAGDQRLEAAVPYLKFRAEKDSVAAVREAAIRGLGAIASPEALTVLAAILPSIAYPDAILALAAEGLLTADSTNYGPLAVQRFEAAKRAKQTALAGALLKIFVKAKAPALSPLAGTLLQSTDIVERLSALDIIALNRFAEHRSAVEALIADKNVAIARKAKAALQAMDTPVQ